MDRSHRAVAAPCRLQWQPSGILALLTGILGWLSGLAALASELPVGISFPLAGVAIGYGMRVALQHAGAEPVLLVIPPGNAPVTVNGSQAEAFQVHWRGPMVFASWSQEGRPRFLLGGPDNVGAVARRELRLAISGRTQGRPRRSVAP